MSECIRTVLDTSGNIPAPEFFASSSFEFSVLSLSKLAFLLPLEGFLSEFVSVLSSECLSVLSPVFVSMWKFEFF